MAKKLPSGEDIAGRVGAPAQTPGITVGKIDYAPMEQGAKALAAGIQGVSSMAQRYGEQQQEQDDFQTQERFINFKLDQEKKFEDAQRSMPVGGGDFAASWDKSYANDAREFMKTVPQHLRQKYDLGLVEFNGRVSKAAGTAQNKAADEYETGRLETTLGRLAGGAESDVDRGEEFRNQGFGLIDASRLSPAAKASARQAFEDRVVSSRYQGLIKAGRSDEAYALAREHDARRPQIPVSAINPKEGGASRVQNAGEVASAIQAGAKELGIDPHDLATVISYETGGSFSPSVRGGAKDANGRGKHIGLIQFGETEQRQYGARQDQSAAEQMKAVVAYLRDRGVKPGMGLLDVYSTVNAGSPGRYNASDAKNGGAPGTVRDKVEQQMDGHRRNAVALLGSQPADYASLPGGASADGVAGDDPAKLRADAAAYKDTNPEAARQMLARADAAEKAKGGQATDGSPAADGTAAVQTAQAGQGAAPTPAPAYGPSEAAAREYAKKWQTQQATEAQKVSAARSEFHERRIIDANAEITPLPPRETIERDTTLTEQSRNTLLRQYDVVAKEQGIAAKGLQKFLNPQGGAFNPYDADDQKAVDRIYKQMGSNEQALRAVVDRTQMVPAVVAQQMRGALVSGSIEATKNAMTMASNLMARKDGIFSKVEGQSALEDAATKFRHYTEDLGMTADEAAKRFIQFASPEYQRQLNAKLKTEDVDKMIREKLTVSDLAGAFDNSWLGVMPNPQIGGTPRLRQQMYTDFAEQVKERYLETGDWALAKKQAANSFKKVWGLSKVSGSEVVMPFPPERAPAYAGIENAGDALAADALAAIKAETGKDVERKRLQFEPIPGVTAEAFRRGNPPPYQVTWTDAEGNIQSLNPGKAFVGMPDALRASQTKERERRFTEGANAAAGRRDQFQGAERNLRGQTMDQIRGARRAAEAADADR